MWSLTEPRQRFAIDSRINRVAKKSLRTDRRQTAHVRVVVGIFEVFAVYVHTKHGEVLHVDVFK